MEIVGMFHRTRQGKESMAKILVIDDDRSVRETLELHLAGEGYEVIAAATARTDSTSLSKILRM